MRIKGNREKIKIKLTSVDWIIEFTGLLLFILLIILPVYYFPKLPDKIPIQFKGSGVPKDFGSKSFIWIFPAAGGFLYTLLTILAMFTRLYNFFVKITPENILVQYKLAIRFIRILKTVIILLFLFICYQTIRISTGDTAGFGNTFLPVFLILIFGIIAIYFTRSLNNKL
jgi:uncharacterized membrane protein